LSTSAEAHAKLNVAPDQLPGVCMVDGIELSYVIKKARIA
jgi:hypothetical protein